MTKYVFLFLVSFLSCSQRNELPIVEIRSVDRNIETPYRVECFYFENAFSDQILKREMKNGDEVERLLKVLDQSEEVTTSSNIDTRMKAYIRYSDRIDTICGDGFTVRYKGKILKLSSELSSIFWDRKTQVPDK